jgi:acyl-coenzyme A thioesterase PaaI-like protein
MTAVRQPGSKMCFVCGAENPIGLHLEFWMDGDQVWTEFTPAQQHQGWPGVLHGGIMATLLDETMGRAAFLHKLWMVTVKMETTYRKPVPLGEPLKITAHIEELRGGRMAAIGQILLPDGSVAVEARGLYLRLPEKQKAAFLSALTGQGIDTSVYE